MPVLKKNNHVMVRLKKQTKDALKRHADELGLYTSQLARIAIEEKLKQLEEIKN